MQNLKKNFFCFLLFNIIVWSLVPLLRNSLPLDTQEALIWGRDYFFGTPKHPPFSGWLAWPFYTIFFEFKGAMYLLSQLCVALGLIYIYRLAKQFVGEQKAILATMLQFGIIFYNFSSVEYNVNVVSVALWPMCVFYFWQAYKQNKWSDWLLFGLFAGLNLLNKYTSGVLLFALMLFILFEKSARRILLNPKAYIATIFALWIFIPHIYWLYETNFVSFEYIFGRGTGGKYADVWLGHIIYPLKFIGAQILFTAAAWLSYLIFYKHSEKQKITHNSMQTKFLLIVGLVPMGIFTLIGIINGAALKSMWGFPLWFLFGITLMYFWPCKISKESGKKLFYAMAGWSMLFALIYAIQCLFTTSPRFHQDNDKTVQTVLQKWQEKTGTKESEYVAADIWYANMFALSGQNIKPLYWFDFNKNPGIDANAVRQTILVVANDEEEYNFYASKYGVKLSSPEKLPVEISNYFGKVKQKELYFGFYNLKRGKK